MGRKYILAAAFISLACPLRAQNSYDLAQFKSEAGLFFRQPGEWGGKDWLTLGVIGAGTLEVHQYDSVIQRSALKHSGNADSFPVQVGEQWGGFFVTPVLGISLLTQGWLAGNEGTKKMGFEIAQAAVYAETISFVLKTAIGRARPGTRGGAGAARSFSFFKSAYNAFPAGHADAAFSLATVLSRSADSTFLKVLPYIPAGLTVASRLYKNEHWASDCFLGAAIGYFTADWVMDRHEKKAKAGAGASGLKIYPYLAGDAVGLGLAVSL